MLRQWLLGSPFVLWLHKKIGKKGMSSYPIIILSSRYKAVEYLVPELPEKPKEPELKLIKKNWFEKLILWCDEYDDLEINNQRKVRYEKQMEQYRQDLAVYQQKVKEILSDTNLSIFRQIERENRMTAYSQGEELSRDVLKGKYEDFFVSKLKRAFGDKISDRIEFTLPNGNAFVPDAAYVDSSTGLCIDIEIDEPYSLPGGKPIHYIGGPDEYRNSFFAGKGWFVLRFAEEQVAKYSDECIGFIKDFISQLKMGTQPSFSHPVDRWSLGDALSFFSYNYRQTY